MKELRGLKRFMAILATVSLLLGLVQTPSHGSPPEQSHFSAEDESVERPVVLPKEVLEIIRRDPDIRRVLQTEAHVRNDALATWLTASEIHLSTPDERDMVVVARGPLIGANVTTFWVLRPSRRGFSLLFTGAAHDLEVKSTRTKGYRDIELWSATAVSVSTALLKFDGERYRLAARKSEAIR